MGWIATVLGIALVALVLWEVFHTLFHPSGQGSATGLLMRLVWRAAWLGRRSRLSSLAGPLGMALVVISWAVVAAAGFTLIYLAQMPDGFSFSPGLRPARRSNLLDSLYLSLVTVGTLGFGDIVPTSRSLRLVAPLEALLGFTVLTAAVSWVLQVYPALTRRRVLALRLAALRCARERQPDRDVDDIPVDLLHDLTAGVVQARVDLTQYAVTYYFLDRDADAALPPMLGYAVDLAHQAEASRRPEIRLAGASLRCAIEDLARVLDRQFLRIGGDTRSVLEAYAADQRHSLR